MSMYDHFVCRTLLGIGHQRLNIPIIQISVTANELALTETLVNIAVVIVVVIRAGMETNCTF